MKCRSLLIILTASVALAIPAAGSERSGVLTEAVTPQVSAANGISQRVFRPRTDACPPRCPIYEPPPGDGGGSGGCTPPQPNSCSWTRSTSTQLQVWCGAGLGYVTIVSGSCLYDEGSPTWCCTSQQLVCSYTDSAGTVHEVNQTVAQDNGCIWEF